LFKGRTQGNYSQWKDGGEENGGREREEEKIVGSKNKKKQKSFVRKLEVEKSK